MIFERSDTPVLILGCKIGGVAIMRSLGSLGVSVFGVDDDPRSPALRSRYLNGSFIKGLDEGAPEEYLDFIRGIGRKLGRPTVLVPTSDELAVFVADQADYLRDHFLFPSIDPALAKGLASKKEMHAIARRCEVPTPRTLFPLSEEDVFAFAEEVSFPVMLKAIHGNRLEARTGIKMVEVNSRSELIDRYRQLEDPGSPNLMIQEHLPGTDDQVFIFNGYFDAQSDCLAGFTGHKIRQYPVHKGAASLGVCTWNEKVARMTTHFMKQVGYQGILDIGYRLDPRDGEYKVLDINPRVGQAFRLFVSEDGMDVIRALYKDLTQQEVQPSVPREGRRWLIEDFDLISSVDYFREGSLGIKDWVSSFRGVEEAAWFNSRDPLPFFMILGRLLKRPIRRLLRRVGLGRSRTGPGATASRAKVASPLHGPGAGGGFEE